MGTSCATGIVDPQGDIADPVRAPDHQVSIGGWYDWTLGNSLTLTPSVNVIDYGDHNISTSGQDVALVDGYTILNASLALASEAGNWRLAAECKNCTDRIQPVSFLAGFVYLQDPKTWSLTFSKRF